MKFEKACATVSCHSATIAELSATQYPEPEVTEYHNEGDPQVLQEVTLPTDLHSNFMLSDGLWDLES